MRQSAEGKGSEIAIAMAAAGMPFGTSGFPRSSEARPVRATEALEAACRDNGLAGEAIGVFGAADQVTLTGIPGCDHARENVSCLRQRRPQVGQGCEKYHAIASALCALSSSRPRCARSLPTSSSTAACRSSH